MGNSHLASTPFSLCFQVTLKYVEVFMTTIAAPADADMVSGALTRTRGVFPSLKVERTRNTIN